MISGNRMHLSSILSVMAKALNTYVHVIFSFLIDLKTYHYHYGVLCVEFREKKIISILEYRCNITTCGKSTFPMHCMYKFGVFTNFREELFPFLSFFVLCD